ncbi:hypothetical protein J6590_089655, partial [Homalodisca vitripennis]
VLVTATHKHNGRSDLGPQEALNGSGMLVYKVGFPMGSLLWAVARALFSNTSADGRTHGCILYL